MSDVALAAAKRFSSASTQRKYADLELVLKELCKPGDTRIGLKPDCLPISRQQLINLLGSPDEENLKFIMWGITYELRYGHTYGSTYFSFENNRLNAYLFFGEPVFWYAPPRQSAVKRAWYKVSRWPRKLIGALF